MLCHDTIESHPEQYDSTFCHFAGAYSEIQWYCPPAVGAEEASSARESTTWRRSVKTRTIEPGNVEVMRWNIMCLRETLEEAYKELSTSDPDHRPKKAGKSSILQTDPTGG